MGKKVYPMCVWTWARGKRYYLLHPVQWVKEFARNVKFCYLRIRDGWCPADTWSWDGWFTQVAPPMFRYLAEHGHAYPGTEPFETPDKWHDWLKCIAVQIESGDPDWQEAHNPYYEKFIKELLTKKSEDMDKELVKNYYDENSRLFSIGHSNVKWALREIGEHFYQIWD